MPTDPQSQVFYNILWIGMAANTLYAEQCSSSEALL